MNDYIERDAVIKTINKYRIGLRVQGLVILDGAVAEVKKRIDSLPNADVRPVKEGHWVEARGSWCSPGGDPVWECSECGKGVHVYGVEHGTYGSGVADGQWVSCPNCGADMRGDKDE